MAISARPISPGHSAYQQLIMHLIFSIGGVGKRYQELPGAIMNSAEAKSETSRQDSTFLNRAEASLHAAQ